MVSEVAGENSGIVQEDLTSESMDAGLDIDDVCDISTSRSFSCRGNQLCRLWDTVLYATVNIKLIHQ